MTPRMIALRTRSARLEALAGILLLLAAVSACDGGGEAREDPKKLTREKAAQLLHEALDGPVTSGSLAGSADRIQSLLSPEQRSRYFCHGYFKGSADEAAAKCAPSSAAELLTLSGCTNEGQVRVIGAGLTELVFLPDRPLIGGVGRAHYCVALKTPELAKYEREGKFVVGEYRVAEVTGMTDPAPMMGVTASQVSFRLRRTPNELGRLTEGTLIETGLYATDKKPKQDLTGKATLVLYDDGWRLEKNSIGLE